eukprot:313157-Pelagomonas_calceolata.AAC.2
MSPLDQQGRASRRGHINTYARRHAQVSPIFQVAYTAELQIDKVSLFDAFGDLEWRLVKNRFCIATYEAYDPGHSNSMQDKEATSSSLSFQEAMFLV